MALEPLVSPSRPKAGAALSALKSAPLASVWSVTALVLAVYAVWAGAYLALGHEPLDFVKIGTEYLEQSDSSDRITIDEDYVPPRNRGLPMPAGYDGQFSYYMALDFENARYYMDLPAYRYTRLLYPVLARGLAFDQKELVPVTLILINWLALGGCTLALAALLRRRGVTPWAAALVGLYPGLFLGFQRNLTEPLAYALVAVAVFLYDYGGRRRLLWAGVAFGLAGLARQTTVVFPVCLLVVILLRGDRETPIRDRLRANAPSAAAFAALSVGPIAAYTGYLYAWLGSVGRGASFERFPFEGLVATSWTLERQGVVVLFVVIPALLFATAVGAAMRRGVRRVEFAYLVVNVLLFVAFLGAWSYGDGWTSVGRVTTGVVLAATLCLPWLRAGPLWAGRAIIASFVLWTALLPVVAVYGFGG